MKHMFVIFVNDHGFIGENDSIVLNIMAAQYFNSRKAAEKHRIKLYSNERKEFKNTISILEWL